MGNYRFPTVVASPRVLSRWYTKRQNVEIALVFDIPSEEVSVNLGCPTAVVDKIARGGCLRIAHCQQCMNFFLNECAARVTKSLE